MTESGWNPRVVCLPPKPTCFSHGPCGFVELGAYYTHLKHSMCRLRGNFSISNNFVYLEGFCNTSQPPSQALYSLFPVIENTIFFFLKSKLQVLLPPFALQATDKSSFHCVKGIRSAKQYKLAGRFSFQREA